MTIQFSERANRFGSNIFNVLNDYKNKRLEKGKPVYNFTVGTPDFALPCLKALIERYDVTAVVTQPDKPRGRGYVLTPPPVKAFAIENGIPVYQPETLKDGAFEDMLREIDPDAIVVVAYGKILPAYILDYPKYGCINVHGSLLPEYRGAAPMQRAIIDGKAVTGVTTMYMAKGLDTGDMLEKLGMEMPDLM